MDKIESQQTYTLFKTQVPQNNTLLDGKFLFRPHKAVFEIVVSSTWV